MLLIWISLEYWNGDRKYYYGSLLLPQLLGTLWNKCCLVKTPLCSSCEATVVSELSNVQWSTQAYSAAPPCAPLPARNTAVSVNKKKYSHMYSMTMLTICVRWWSLSKRFLPLVTSSSNSLNFCSICISSSTASVFWPSFPRCKVVSENMHDLVSSVHELFRVGDGTETRQETVLWKKPWILKTWDWKYSWQGRHSLPCHIQPRKSALTSLHLILYLSGRTCTW